VFQCGNVCAGGDFRGGKDMTSAMTGKEGDRCSLGGAGDGDWRRRGAPGGDGVNFCDVGKVLERVESSSADDAQLYGLCPCQPTFGCTRYRQSGPARKRSSRWSNSAAARAHIVHTRCKLTSAIISCAATHKVNEKPCRALPRHKQRGHRNRDTQKRCLVSLHPFRIPMLMPRTP
jgi:hypothetical protein